jgi:hypothetical protein
VRAGYSGWLVVEQDVLPDSNNHLEYLQGTSATIASSLQPEAFEAWPCWAGGRTETPAA